MPSTIEPSQIYRMRLALLKTLLGPGWLGSALARGRSAATVTPAGAVEGVHTWTDLERRYGRLVRYLAPGLRRLCRPVAATEPLPAAGRANRPAEPRDVPPALLHSLRTRPVVSPAGVDTSCLVTASDLLTGVVPLLAWIYCLHEQTSSAAGGRPARTLVLLAGIPGSGKSVVAALIERYARLTAGFPQIQAVGMDGWHLPNRVIEARQIRDEAGRIVPLASRKGSAESFDVRALVRDIEAWLQDPSFTRFPAYDRRLHEPVADAVEVGTPIMLLEGNYLLLPSGDWARLTELCSGAAWLDAPADLARESLARRHTTGGRSMIEAEARWTGNDWPNAVTALAGRAQATAVIYLNGSRRMQFLHRVSICP